MDQSMPNCAGVNAVVTGAAGFIGSWLASALAAAGARVVGVDKAWGRPDRLPPREVPAAVPPHRCAADLYLADTPTIFAGADVVFHLAGLPGVWPSWTEFDEYLRHNVAVTKRVLDGCLAAGVPRLVLASSSSIYGDGADGLVAEDQTPRPISPYAVTKLAAEQLALAYAARDVGLTVIVLRYFTVYGPGQRPDMLISRAIRAALSGTSLRIHGDGTHRRDFVYVDDVVRANLLAMSAPLDSQVMNVGSASTVSVNEVLDLVGELTGARVEVRYAARRHGDVHATYADIGRITERLGYQPRTGLRQGLSAQVAAERERAAGGQGVPALVANGSAERSCAVS